MWKFIGKWAAKLVVFAFTHQDEAIAAIKAVKQVRK
jgi:hypothetical protein